MPFGINWIVLQCSLLEWDGFIEIVIEHLSVATMSTRKREGESVFGEKVGEEKRGERKGV